MVKDSFRTLTSGTRVQIPLGPPGTEALSTKIGLSHQIKLGAAEASSEILVGIAIANSAATHMSTNITAPMDFLMTVLLIFFVIR